MSVVVAKLAKWRVPEAVAVVTLARVRLENIRTRDAARAGRVEDVTCEMGQWWNISTASGKFI